MEAPQAVARDYYLIQYLQISTVPSNPKPKPFSLVLPEESTLRDALTTHVALLRLRLGVYGAFVVLIDERCPYFLAGSTDSETREDGECSCNSTSWLGTDDAELQQWLLILRQTIAVDISTNMPNTSIISSLSEDERSAKLTSVCGDPHLFFYAAAPITSKQEVPIGAVFVVDTAARETLSAKESGLLKDTAQKCMQHLESAREGAHKERWERMNEQLGHFVGSRAIRDQQLEEPPSLGNSDQQKRREQEIGGIKDIALRHGHDPSMVEEAGLQGDANEGPESTRVMDAEAERDKRIADVDEKRNARTLTAQADSDRRRGTDYPGQTTYYKIFRRAAECLQEALHVDGVLFTNGLIGYHGAIQAVGQLEEDLRQEMVKRPQGGESVAVSAGRSKDASRDDDQRQRRKDDTEEKSTITRTYTSPEYWRGVCIEQPAEIIGFSTRDPSLAPKIKQTKETTSGLATLGEAHLQVLMERYPDGNVWYIPDDDGVCYQVRNGTLVEDTSKETQHLLRSLPAVQQIIFQPLTDPVSLKRLAGCFAWSAKKFPVLTDTMDVPALRGFLRVLESEISRHDAATAVKQKESFVSSVSHELRTPIHGILGSVQLLADTHLDHFQVALADTIKTSGTALNETLTSVLSYAKINQFERQQNKYRDRRPPDAEWSLPNKMPFDLGPDTDFKGLYICTNVALLCEEVSGVLQASQAYSGSKTSSGADVVLDIDYADNWKFYTEPGALRRIAINIIGNALKYTEKGSVAIALAVSDIDTGDADHASRRMITFSVKDTGKGMSKEFMAKHLFIPFTQEDATSSHGVGLGMSIVKSLVSLLAGEIRVKSQVGQGTEVTVSIPMRAFDPGQSEEEEPALQLELCTASLRREQLCVVLFGFPEIIQRSLQTYLRTWFNCKISEAAEEAKPDVVLVDEGNEDAVAYVERTARSYSQSGVLLSIATGPETLSKPMRQILGYRKWERVPRPIGPLNLGRAMQSCVEKLRSEVHEHLATDRNRHEKGTQEQDVQHTQDDQGHKTSERPTVSGGNGQDSSGSSTEAQSARPSNPESHPARTENTPPEQTTNDRPVPSRSASFHTAGRYEGSADPSTLRVLVAEDNVVNKRILGAFLQKYGCRDVKNAENGAVAVEAVEGNEQSFDVIFMDLSMPVMDGFQATREIRRIERSRASSNESSDLSRSGHSYIVALTAQGNHRDHADTIAAGVDQFVTKPVSFEKIKQVLRQREGAA